jgi:hypothetical protein
LESALFSESSRGTQMRIPFSTIPKSATKWTGS